MQLSSKSRGGLADFSMFFIALMGMFIWLRYPILHATGIISVDDFAANDLLVIDAKALQLLHGNYSRVGFYHPGPFFFQIMAWFEQLFFETLHTVGSPVGAHVLAALALHAAAIAALYCAGSAYFNNRLAGFVLAWLTVVIACCVIDSRQFYNGQLFFLTGWPPFLYMAAVLFPLAGITAMLAGRAYGLPLVTAGLMMLIHGHASFIGLVPIMAVVIAAFFYWRRHTRTRTSDMQVDGVFGRWAVGISVVIVLLFCFPIAYNTAVHWPGEIPKYFAFAGQRESRPGWELLAYWWTFSHWSLLAIPVFLLVCTVHRQRPANQLFMLVLLTFLPPVILFSVRGLDTLEYKYPLFWCAPVLGFLAGLAFVELTAGYRERTYRVAATVFVLLFGCASLLMFKRQGVFESAPDADFRNAVAQLRSVNAPGKMVWLEVDTSQILAIVYTTSLAVQDKRSGIQSFCVTEKTWNIAYTQKYLCGHDVSNRSTAVFLTTTPATGTPLFKIGPVSGMVR